LNEPVFTFSDDDEHEFICISNTLVFTGANQFEKTPVTQSTWFWNASVMEWEEDSEKRKRTPLTHNEKIIFYSSLTIITLLILILFSPLLTPWIYESNEYSASIRLQSEDDSWLYGNITLTYGDTSESMNITINGPWTETFSNGTLVTHNYRDISIPRRFQGSISTVLVYNCTGQGMVIGPIHFLSDSFGVVYDNGNGFQISWNP